jgi:YidC/Oxa1 family membrane protein insertase
MSLPIFMLLTQMVLQKMSQPAKDPKTGKADSQTQMMGQMMFLMPVMFFWITLGLPAGLTLYWSVSNVLGMVQQYFVTGWGSLPDWFGFLKKSQQPATVPAAAAMPAQQALPATTDEIEKPVKRRKRRK